MCLFLGLCDFDGGMLKFQSPSPANNCYHDSYQYVHLMECHINKKHPTQVTLRAPF